MSLVMHRSRSSYAVDVNAEPSSDSGSDQEQSRSRAGAEQSSDADVPYTAAKHASDVPIFKRAKRYMLLGYYRAAALAQHERFMQALTLLTLMAVVALWVLHARESTAQTTQHQQRQHLVLIDAGSTGTRVHVFSYRQPGLHAHHGYASLDLPEPKFKVFPGLSSYAADPSAAAASLAPLLQFAYEHVPRGQWASTPVRLMATAGLRLLPPRAAARVLEHCRAALQASRFRFEEEWAEVISGEAEGIYGWVAVNTVAGRLQEAAVRVGSRKELTDDHFHGLLELGGASVQVTFVPKHQESKRRRAHMAIPGLHKPLFTHSFLGLGFDMLEKKVQALVKDQHAISSSNSKGPPNVDPCLPKGYMSEHGHHGSGDWRACQQLVARAMDPAHCRAAVGPCSQKPPKDVPQLTGTFLAIENFFWTAQALQLPKRATINDLADAGSRFCEQPWESTLTALPQGRDTRLLWRYCFGAAFVWTLLHDVFRIGHNEYLQFTNSLTQEDGQEVGLDWAVGAAVLQLTHEVGRARWRANLSTCLLTAAVLGTVMVVLLACALLLQSWRTFGDQRQRKRASVVVIKQVQSPSQNGQCWSRPKASS